ELGDPIEAPRTRKLGASCSHSLRRVNSATPLKHRSSRDSQSTGSALRRVNSATPLKLRSCPGEADGAQALRRVNSATPLKQESLHRWGSLVLLSSPSELGDPIEARRAPGSAPVA